MKEKDYLFKPDSILIGLTLTIVGGFLDAFTYILSNGKFATMQTGNLILFVYDLFRAGTGQAFLYLVPVGFFIVGVFISRLFENKLSGLKSIRREQIILIMEIILLVPVIFIEANSELSFIVNALVSLVAGLQVETFKKILSRDVATTMCTGNVQKTARELADVASKTGKFKNVLILVVTIVFFLIGCAIGFFLAELMGVYSIFIPIGLLTVPFVLLFIKRNSREELAEA